MAALAGILNYAKMAGQTVASDSAAPMASSSSGSSGTTSSDSTSATISANDFLTLLVTEMQNQDPTATTDPNEYINQLVQVNSLEQLISINQNVSTALDTSAVTTPTKKVTTSGSDPAGKNPVAAAAQEPGPARNGSAFAAAKSGASPAIAAGSQAIRAVTNKHVSGNLSVPETAPAAHRVASALDGQAHPQSILGGLRAVR